MAGSLLSSPRPPHTCSCLWKAGPVPRLSECRPLLPVGYMHRVLQLSQEPQLGDAALPVRQMENLGRGTESLAQVQQRKSELGPRHFDFRGSVWSQDHLPLSFRLVIQESHQVNFWFGSHSHTLTSVKKATERPGKKYSGQNDTSLLRIYQLIFLFVCFFCFFLRPLPPALEGRRARLTNLKNTVFIRQTLGFSVLGSVATGSKTTSSLSFLYLARSLHPKSTGCVSLVLRRTYNATSWRDY